MKKKQFGGRQKSEKQYEVLKLYNSKSRKSPSLIFKMRKLYKVLKSKIINHSLLAYETVILF